MGSKEERNGEAAMDEEEGLECSGRLLLGCLVDCREDLVKGISG